MMKTIFLAITLLITTLSLQAQCKVDVHKEIEFAKAQYEFPAKTLGRLKALSIRGKYTHYLRRLLLPGGIIKV
ncbi:MAG TPA: hypothetical protein VK541_12870 [Pedobacter sp.]|nr:hypothetical protein [Pedobacter sp.]HMI03374.1 hypothetical protein [Pedobacter sp.]